MDGIYVLIGIYYRIDSLQGVESFAIFLFFTLLNDKNRLRAREIYTHYHPLLSFIITKKKKKYGDFDLRVILIFDRDVYYSVH